jgi:hypothetical protein
MMAYRIINYEWNILLEEAPAVSSRVMSLFQAPPTLHFALLDTPQPHDIQETWLKICGDRLQWMPSNNVVPQVGTINQKHNIPVMITVTMYVLREWKLLI